MKKHALALLLALCMVIAMLPAAAFAAPVRQTADIQVQPRTAFTPDALPQLPAASNQGDYKITAEVLEEYPNGTVELYASRADAQELVYMMVDPDPGYAPEFLGGYSYSEHDMVMTYIGLNLWEIQMPDGDVEFVIPFYEIIGDSYTVEVNAAEGVNWYILDDITNAKEGESVFLCLEEQNAEVTADCESFYDLGYLEEAGVHIYELIMPADHVNININTSAADNKGNHHWRETVTLDGFETFQIPEPKGVVDPSIAYFTMDFRFVPELTGSYSFYLAPVEEDEANPYAYTVDMDRTHWDYGSTIYFAAEAGETVELRFQYPSDDGRYPEFNYYMFYEPNHNYRETLSLGETKTIRIPEPMNGVVDPNWTYYNHSFFFTPEETGTYRFLVDYVQDEAKPYEFEMGVAGAYWALENGCEFDAVAGETRELTFQYHPYDGRHPEFTFTLRNAVNPITTTVETGLGGYAFTYQDEAKAGDTVALICQPEAGYRVAQITGVDGLVDNGDNSYFFTMPDVPVDIRVLFLRENNPFLDINETQFFYDSVLWAVEQKITNGLDNTHFDPFGICNRAQVVTFLWRYAGSPEPVTTDCTFTDVQKGSWYEKPVLWAVENGITNGISTTEFGADLPCNRAQVVTFLWRYLKQPVPGLTEHPFTDVQAASWYEAPVLWAVENGITNGATPTTFNPDGQCQRAQVVTFLYRTAQLTPAPVYYALHTQFDAEMGNVTLSHTEAMAGETITATVVPNEGYMIESVSCLGGSEVTQVSDGAYTFVMPEGEETFSVTFAPIPAAPVKTFELDLRDNGSGTVSYVDGKTTAAPGESIFFYAVPNEGYYLDHVGIFNPDGTIDVSTIQIHEHGNDLYELIMIPHDLIMTCYFYPNP